MKEKLIIKNNTNYDKTILVIGVVHGDEPQGEILINKFLEKDFVCKNRLFFVPRLNSSNTRKNPNGVDLNRNFPTKNWTVTDCESDYFGGFSANSEVETKIVVDLLNKYNFDAIITIHAPFRLVNYDCHKDCKITKPLASKIASYLDYPVEGDIGYPTPGSFGTYAGIERGIPTITIELSENEKIDDLFLKFDKIFNYLANEF